MLLRDCLRRSVRFVECSALVLGLALAPSRLFAQAATSEGTLLPVMLNTSLDTRSAEPGQKIVARMMDDVRLPDGSRLSSGAKVVGHVVAVSRLSEEGPSSITLQLDHVVTSHREISIVTNLRAIASMIEVNDARVPMFGPDREANSPGWRPRGIGNDKESLMRCGEMLREKGEPVQFWIFHSSACGSYGFPHMSVREDAPKGQIVLTSDKHNLNLRGDTGLLLRSEGAVSQTSANALLFFGTQNLLKLHLFPLKMVRSVPKMEV
jgi:hypothetical protein